MNRAKASEQKVLVIIRFFRFNVFFRGFSSFFSGGFCLASGLRDFPWGLKLKLANRNIGNLIAPTSCPLTVTNFISDKR